MEGYIVLCTDFGRQSSGSLIRSRKRLLIKDNMPGEKHLVRDWF
jgi:hypothetical protein